MRAEFARDRAILLGLLRDLGPDDWDRPTAAAPWRVRDVLAHLLGDDVGRISRLRDGHPGPRPAAGEPLAAFIHRINDEWVDATARISPPLLVDMFALSSAQVLATWQACDLDAIGQPVTWAGPEPAPVWLDCARDFTEYWVHQQQIREATGRTGHGDPAIRHRVLDVFLRAMPLTLRSCGRPDGTALTVTVPGESGGAWSWRATGGRWDPAPDTGDGDGDGDGDGPRRRCRRH